MTESSAPEGEMPPLPETQIEEITVSTIQDITSGIRSYARKYAATSAAQAASGGAVRMLTWAEVAQACCNNEQNMHLIWAIQSKFIEVNGLAAPDHPSPSQEGPSDAEMLTFLLAHCKVVYYPTGSGYPVEHNPFALGYPKDGAFLLGALRAAMKEHQP